MYGYVKVGSAVPKLRVADCVYNKEEILKLVEAAAAKQVRVLSFPELSVTGYTCADLFFQTPLLHAAEQAIQEIAEATEALNIFLLIGAPIAVDNQMFNCAVALYKGKLLGIVPKTHIPNYSEFYEERWFASADDLLTEEITYAGQNVPIGADLIFAAADFPALKIGVEICEDLWVPIPPSSYLSLYGATLLLNLSASNELASKPGYRRQLVSQQSARCLSAYVYTSAGTGESTQDAVFSGHSMIYENGTLFAETESFSRESQFVYADIDVEMLMSERRKHTTFMTHLQKAEAQKFYRQIFFDMAEDTTLDNWSRPLSNVPFTPTTKLDARCKNIFAIQTTGLARRMEHTHADSLVIGISGGLDSTLALLVTARAFDLLGLPRENILAVTMPCFGTTDRTYHNALTLAKTLGASLKEVRIAASVTQHFKDIGQDPELHDVTYENGQARERTQVLMDLANQRNGIVIGTGDLSELALGWATYNGDHMSMYGVNAGVPKTLVSHLVRCCAEAAGEKEPALAACLLDVLDTPVSPELLPPTEDGKISQKTEDLVGPYELHDYFLYYMLRCGYRPRKIFRIAQQSFAGIYDSETILKWEKNFMRRFFSQQFKRSCLPDGPKVGSVAVSPRGDLRMPSDACAELWKNDLP